MRLDGSSLDIYSVLDSCRAIELLNAERVIFICLRILCWNLWTSVDVFLAGVFI